MQQVNTSPFMANFMNEIHCGRSQGWKSFCKPEWSKKPCSLHGSYRKKQRQKQNNDRKNLFLLLQSSGPAWESGYLCRGEVYTEYMYRPLRQTSRLKRVQSIFL